MKRLIDFTLAFMGLALLWPLLAAISLAIILTSGRPALFSQVRIGRHNCEFVIKKFRTMKACSGKTAAAFGPGSTERITAFGKILRALKLDELPQLWNVIKGEMSLVGPRPEVQPWVDTYPDRWKTVLSIKPGITDPASLAFRNEEYILAQSLDPENVYGKTILPQKLGIYEAYVRDHSCSGDLLVIVETIAAIFSDRLCPKR